MAYRSNCISGKQSYLNNSDTHLLRRKTTDSVTSTKDRSAWLSWEGYQYLPHSYDIWNFLRSILNINLCFSFYKIPNRLGRLDKFRLLVGFSCFVLDLIQANQLGSSNCVRNCWLWHCLSVNLECKTVCFGLADYLLHC